MNLSAFETYVKNLVNSGGTIDTVLRDEIRTAGMFLEFNYSFLYMEAFRAFTQSSGNRYVALSARPKRIELLRQVNADGTYKNFDQVDPRDFDEADIAGDAAPSVFWLDGQGEATQPATPRLVLNLTPTQDLSMEILEVRLTNWDSLDDASTHWLFDFGRAALAYRTIFQIFGLPILRDTEGQQQIAPLLKDALDTVLNYDDDLRRSLRSEELRFGRNV